MAIVRINPESRESWLDMRKRDITSTEASCLFGCNPYKRAYELWHDKHNPSSAKTVEQTDRMKWGLRLEREVARGIAEDQGWEVRHMPYYVRDDEARVGASFDYEILKMDAIFEVKCVDRWATTGWILDEGHTEAPPHIELQLQVQMALSGKSRGFIGALIGGNEVVLIERSADMDIWAEVKKRAAMFWASVATGIEPAPDYMQDADAVIRLHQSVTDGEVLDASENVRLEELVRAYRDSGATVDEWETRKRAAKAEMMELIGTANKVIGNGFTISAGTTKRAEYTVKATEYRDFRITMKKGAKA